MTAIAEVYRRYEHLDSILSRFDFNGNLQMKMIKDMWLAIKETLPEFEVTVTYKRIDENDVLKTYTITHNVHALHSTDAEKKAMDIVNKLGIHKALDATASPVQVRDLATEDYL